MELKEYFDIKRRMTNNCAVCGYCPFENKAKDHDLRSCSELEFKYLDEAIAIAETWKKEHPYSTNNQAFDDMVTRTFPDIDIDDCYCKNGMPKLKCDHKCEACREYWKAEYIYEE